MDNTEFIIKCGCKSDDCNLHLVVSPMNTISICGKDKDDNLKYITGVYISLDDSVELIEQLKIGNANIIEQNGIMNDLVMAYLYNSEDKNE